MCRARVTSTSSTPTTWRLNPSCPLESRSTESTSRRLSRETTWSPPSSIPKRAPIAACRSTPTSDASRRKAVFTPIPAVDIRGGRCVRLVEGDFSRETRYADDPAEMARHWEAEGAQRLHVVDLDGARDGLRANASTIATLLRAVSIPVQVGGGIRSLETARELLEQGASRVIVGTAAAERPEVLCEWLDTLGAEQFVVGLDARDGKVATRGWLNLTDVHAVSFGQQLAARGV